MYQTPDIFNENFVLEQLKTTGTVAYFNLMQHGYPFKVRINELFENMKRFLEPRHISLGSETCCRIFLLCKGFENKDFRIGKTDIHIRLGKSDLFNQLLSYCDKSVAEDSSKVVEDFKKGFLMFMRRVFCAQIKFAGTRKFFCCSRLFPSFKSI